MNAAEVLRAQQRALQAAITSHVAPSTRGLLATSHDGTPARLSIYRHAYRTRLIAALADNHTMLQRALGDEAFDALARAYIDACPSQQPSIRWYGHRLAEFMASREDLVPHPALVDIARMDWALRDAFDAADAPTLDLATLSNVPPEHWAALRVAPHPSVRTLALQWAVEAAWRALREHDPESDAPEPELPEPERQAHTLLVWRRGLETQWRSLSADEASLLQAALQGDCFGELCERAAVFSNDDAATTAALALQQWLHDGLFTALHG
jgi:hypothetical protein